MSSKLIARSPIELKSHRVRGEESKEKPKINTMILNGYL